jgi:hypothetical protein
MDGIVVTPYVFLAVWGIVMVTSCYAQVRHLRRRRVLYSGEMSERTVQWSAKVPVAVWAKSRRGLPVRNMNGRAWLRLYGGWIEVASTVRVSRGLGNYWWFRSHEATIEARRGVFRPSVVLRGTCSGDSVRVRIQGRRHQRPVWYALVADGARPVSPPPRDYQLAG